MVIDKFPPIETADEYGLLAIGGDLETESLLMAYSQGIFPWPISDDVPLAWFSPDPRGILFYKNLKLPSSFHKFLKKTQFKVTFNTAFEEVIYKCAHSKNRKLGDGTWINEEIILSYINLFKKGHAYSVETYDGDKLVGGLYGVHIGGFVNGESMFYLEPNASKLALYSLMNHLYERGITWLDTQMVTDVVKSFGGEEIRRRDYISLLNKSLALNVDNLFSKN